MSCSASLIVPVFFFVALTANDFDVSKQFLSEAFVCQMVHLKGDFGFLTSIATVMTKPF